MMAAIDTESTYANTVASLTHFWLVFAAILAFFVTGVRRRFTPFYVGHEVFVLHSAPGFSSVLHCAVRFEALVRRCRCGYNV